MATSNEAALRAFFQASKYAVVGASTNTAKYGYKIFKWYIDHSLQATPINPSSPSIPVDGESFTTSPSLSAVAESQDGSLADTAVSVITPPAVTLKALQEAKGLGVTAVFLQPGTFNDEVIAYARGNFETVLAGEGGRGGEGWCVLVDGERGLNAAGKL
ncbi:CoA binding domain-containing protein [Staphylotrichum tortipilum]|uniref:CoA binding domain-containing protein n=1 Tax=Staphylotrichum tortipilum TaxID=2831512 RepID=A0AAN6MT48_9PEZI|nr:CoA binding domain-containing protein [Staphylotrichum longicolle]